MDSFAIILREVPVFLYERAKCDHMMIKKPILMYKKLFSRKK